MHDDVADGHPDLLPTMRYSYSVFGCNPEYGKMRSVMFEATFVLQPLPATPRNTSKVEKPVAFQASVPDTFTFVAPAAGETGTGAFGQTLPVTTTVSVSFDGLESLVLEDTSAEFVTLLTPDGTVNVEMITLT